MDPFDFNKLDKVGSGQPSSASTPSSRLGSVGGPAAAQAPGGAVPSQDDVELSEEAGGVESAGFGAGVNFGAWTAQASPPESKASQAGMQAGVVIGPEGLSGLEPGMHPGGVHNASERDRPA